MWVLRLRPYPRARPALDDDELQIAVVDEGAWFLSRVRGHNWKYRTTHPFVQGQLGDNPAQIATSAQAVAGTPEDDPWLPKSRQWAASRQPVTDDDDVPAQLSALYDDDHWIAGSQKLWPASKTVVSDDGDGVSATLSVDDDGAFTYRHRVAGWRLFHPSRRGGSADNSQTFIFDDDPWLAIKQRTWAHSRPLLDDDALPQQVGTLGVEDDSAFVYRNRVPGWKLIYPSRRGGSADNSDPITPLGVEDDSWQPTKQRLWKLAAAISDDDPYVNTCAEEYLWIATQAFWQTPLVPITDDEILLQQNPFGLDEEHWFGGRTETWKPCGPLLDDEVAGFPEPEPQPTGQVDRVGGGTSRRIKDLPQYYSRQIFDREIQLPQAPEANRVAQEVLDRALELLESEDDFDALLADVDALRQVVAAHIESRQIYDVVEEVKARIQARRDAEIAVLIEAKTEEDEVRELMELLWAK